MPPRSSDQRRTARRGDDPIEDRTVVPLHAAARDRAGPGGAGAARGGLSAARRYSPRGRTVREAAEGRGDPFRPALQAVTGGQRTSARRAAASGRTADPPTARRSTSGAAATGAASPKAASPKAASPKAGRVQAPGPKVGRTKVAGPKAGRMQAPGPKVRRMQAPGPKVGRTKADRRRPPPAPPPPPRLGEPRRRLRLATVLALAMFLVIVGRLVQIQLTDAKAYATEGLNDRLTTVDLPAPRGTIFDRERAILVHSLEARYVYADPTLVVDPERTASSLFEVLGSVGVTRSELLERISPHRRPDGTKVEFEYLARGVDINLGNAVVAMELPGIGVRRDERRDVPGHDLAANVLGFTRKGDHAGLAGIEAEYDRLLRGVDGKRTFEIGERKLAREIPGGYLHEISAQPGTSLRLTLDRDVQYEVQYDLTTRMQEVQATFGCAVVLDIKTSEILAQASYPTYDAANPSGVPDAQRVDACTEKVFDPGSVHKAIVVGAALQEGVLQPNSTITVDPSIRKGDQTYRDSHPQKAGTAMTLPGVLALSSNVGTIKIADMLGRDKLYQYQRLFGLGAPTKEGLPNEAAGAVLPPKEWTGSSPGSIPIGDGVAVTALQMAAVYATIANDGLWVQPHLVAGTITPDGREVRAPDPVTRRVLSAEHARQLRTMLEAVTTLDGATGRRAAIQGYRVAGKTGTGLLPANGGYAPGNVASFIGMAPADAPRFVIAVFAHTPSGSGGTVAGPAFRDMMAFLLGRYQVPPTGTTPPTFSVYP